MAIRNIRQVGDPILRKTSKKLMKLMIELKFY